MAFQQALSGLSASSKAIDVVSNNIANAATVGFKSGSAVFSDVFASALTGAASTGQVGIGAAANVVRQNFTQGGTTSTGNPLDLAINGNGFFVIQRNDGTEAFSRNGQFDIDRSGFIVTASGDRVVGSPADAPGTRAPLQVPQDQIDPQPTADDGGVPAVSITANLDSRVEASTTVPPAWAAFDPADGATFDEQLTPIAFTGNDGNTKTVDVYVRRQASGADDWEVFYVIDAGDGVTPETVSGGNLITNGSSATLAASVFNTPPDADQALDLNFDWDGTTGWTLNADVDAVNVASEALPDDATVAFLSPPPAELVPFDPSNPSTYASTTALTVYDSRGNPHTLTAYFVKDVGENGDWLVYGALDGGTPQLLSNQDGSNVLSFSTVGRPDGGVEGTRFNFGPVDLGDEVDDLAFTIDLSRVTSFGSANSVTQLDQNGFASGELASIGVSREGVVEGRYTNGQTRALGTVLLATFTNPNGLVSVGNNLWAASFDSGEPAFNAPGQGLNGVVASGVVEDSNVDLTRELVQLIIMQRNYQANAQSIRTQDQLLQTVVNLR